MLPTNYLGYNYALVQGGSADLLKVQGLLDSSISKSRMILEALKAQFGALSVKVYVAESEDAFRYDIYGKGPLKGMIIGQFYYLPPNRQLDIHQQGQLMIQFKGKTVAYEGYGELFKASNLPQIYNKYTSII